MSAVPVTIFLENGASFEGLGWGDFSKPRGSEFVFCTAMTGLEESLTDPSFARQTLVTTVSHVGNTGYTREDGESSKIWAEGLICRHLEDQPSNWRSKKSLPEWITGDGRYIVSNVDTRALTILLRETGSQRGVVCRTGEVSAAKARELIPQLVPDMNGLDLTGDVTCPQPYAFGGGDKGHWPLGRQFDPLLKRKNLRIAVWDFGVKTNTLRLLKEMGSDVQVMPARSTAEAMLEAGRDGILLSNGPGDPAAATHIIAELKKVLGRKPLFAICLGHQLVARALDLKTYKMKFGHRGIHHPVVELDASGTPLRTWITSQNHGFAVDPTGLGSRGYVSFTHADDGSVEGLTVPSLQVETVQFHPEAAPGPSDSSVLLKKFVMEVVPS